MEHMVYVGPEVHLHCKTALIMPAFWIGMIWAQFDDVETGCGYRWHLFQLDYFAEVEE